jgi:PKD repeat protein
MANNLTVNFTVISGHTVPSNYSWDNGVPFSTTSPLVCTILMPVEGVIDGYAPGVKVFIENNSNLTTSTLITSISAQYIWDFEDFYNTDNNTYMLTCSTDITHVYVMPGEYQATLTVVESYLQINPVTQIIGVKTETKSITKKVCIVREVPPIANLYSVTQPVIGESPYTVRLTARTTIPGSFPVDKILWDFGDGSEKILVSRYYNEPNNNLVFNNIFTNDLEDPRNYDVLHTYNRECSTYPVFYPSITAYSSSTDNLDTCSLTIGPIFLPPFATQFHLLKSRNTPYGNLYSVEIDKNITFITTQSSADRVHILNPTIPPNLIRNSLEQPVISLGNPGTDYYTVSGLC